VGEYTLEQSRTMDSLPDSMVQSDLMPPPLPEVSVADAI
jgi:hypothetical protein